MQRLSANVPEARVFIEATLLRPLDNNSNGESSSSNDLKRKAIEECKNCKEYYEVDDNRKKRCRYHPGEFFRPALILHYISHQWHLLKITLVLVGKQKVDYNSKAWDEYDYRDQPDQEDPILMNDPAYEDGYYMSCCYQRPYEDGCVVSRHKPIVKNPQGLKKRKR
jgi:hypothetical protein